MEGYCDEAVKELNEGADLESVCKKYRSFAVQTLKLEEEDYTDMSVYTADMYVGETSTVMGEEDVAKLFEMEENGSYSYCNTPNGYLVFRRIPNFEKESEYTNLKSTIVAEMNEDVYTAYVDEIVSAYNYLEDLEAVDYYSVEKIK